MDCIKDSDQMAPKPVLILSGKIYSQTFLNVEFNLTELFSLRIGDSTFREILEKQIAVIKDKFEIIWNDTDSLTEILSQTMGKKNVFIYDCHQYLPGLNTLEMKLRSQLVLEPPATPGSRSHLESPAQSAILSFQPHEFVDLRDTAKLFSFLLLKSPHRHFNEFEIQNGFVVKKCTFESKGKREFTFLNSIPVSIRQYFPQVQKYSEGSGWQQYEVEMIRTFDFGRISMHGKIGLQVFKDLLAQIEQFILQSPKVEVSSRRYKQHLQSLFIDKLKARYKELLTTSVGQAIANENDLLKKIEELIQLLQTKIENLREHELMVTHGDMCFSNILYGIQSKSLKFIDPRGITSPEEIYGPWYYDLAKLSHSVFGQYDIIINDVKPNQELDQLFASMRSYFTSWVTEHGWDFEFLRLCEASLFFSMLPFHISRPDHAKLQFNSGLQAMEAAKSFQK